MKYIMHFNIACFVVIAFHVFLSLPAICKQHDKKKQWSATEEWKYVNGSLSKKEEMNEAIIIFEYIKNSKLDFSIENSFIFIGQVSPDNGIYNSILAIECGKKLCLVGAIDNNKFIRMSKNVQIHVQKCPELDSSHYKDAPYPGILSTYVVCRVNSHIKRFATYKPKSFNMKTPYSILKSTQEFLNAQTTQTQ
jgi:hypothetical protein